MSSCIFITDETLEPLISKNIKAIPNLQGVFRSFKSAYTPKSSPVIFENGFYFVHIKRNSLLFVSATQAYDVSANVMLIVSFLDQFHLLLEKYLAVPILDKNMILDNVLLIMELIDESIDFGVIQITDASIMRDYIRVEVNMPDSKGANDLVLGDSDSDEEGKKKARKHGEKPNLYKFLRRSKDGSHKSKHEDSSSKENENEDSYNSYIAKTTIMPVSWRAKGIHYGRNEFFLDVVEQVQYLVDLRSGIIKKNLIHGKIQCKSYLSGMPKLKIALNKLSQGDELFISHLKFHQCVTWPPVNEKEIEFIPPDGNFVLCQYELKRHVKDRPMLKLVSFDVKAKLKKFKVQLSCTIETHFKARNSTSTLNLKIPLSRLFKDYHIDLRKPVRFKSDSGKVLFNISDDFLLWEIESMRGGHGETQLSMVAEFSLFNKEEYEKEQEELKNSMNPPPLREGPKLEELYDQVHGEKEGSTLVSQLLEINFEIPYCTCSGLQVEYLKIIEEQLEYQSFPWVRYKTISDEEYGYFV